MDKRLYFLHSLVMAPDNIAVSIPDEPCVQTESDLNRLLDSIFTVDEKSGLPRTDIQYYLSARGFKRLFTNHSRTVGLLLADK